MPSPSKSRTYFISSSLILNRLPQAKDSNCKVWSKCAYISRRFSNF